ncbi:MAG: hypothetical protein LUF92_13585 [Clostridiales bacterium]|nr:hypothetical protein [Clostridiales bacterium]
MRVSTSKSKNAESFYITKSYYSDQGKSTSKIVRRLGTLSELSEKLGTDRDGVMIWAREQAKLETEKYKSENERRKILITFRADRQLDYNGRKFYEGGYLFLQSVYYKLKLDEICRKIKRQCKCDFDLNAVLSSLVYARILDAQSEESSYVAASRFLEAPNYDQEELCSAIRILSEKCDRIQEEVYKNSGSIIGRKEDILYFNRVSCSFEKQANDVKFINNSEDDMEPVFQLGMFRDGDDIPMAFSLYPKERRGQSSEKSVAEQIFEKFGCERIICLDDENPLFQNKMNEVETCFGIMKKDFYQVKENVSWEDCVKVHFLICFLADVIIRFLEKEMGNAYSCQEIIKALKNMNFASMEEQGYMPLYTREKITDALHDACGFHTDYQFINKSKMREIQKKSKGRK